MCMIVFKGAGVELPKEEHLRESASRNKDGIGIAYLKVGINEVRIKKDFKDVDVLISWLKDNITKEDICIVHFRLATHGLVDEGNRHPFPITKNKELLRKTELICQMAVAHNGVISQYEHKKFSDTQKFVLDILSEESVKNNLDNPGIQKLISNFIGLDRLVILLANGTGYRWGEWIKEGDIYYSNSGYKAYFTNRYDWIKDTVKIGKDYYLQLCDVCGMKEDTKYITYKKAEYYMCKSCRRDVSNGKIKEEDFYTYKEGQEYDNIKTPEITEHQCENCLSWTDERELLVYYGAKLCGDCIAEFSQWYEVKEGKKEKK